MEITKFKIYALLTKREVKRAGYWPNSVFAFLLTEILKKCPGVNSRKYVKQN